jgi:hypothetical protein
MDRAARQGVIMSQTEQDRSSVLPAAHEWTRAEMTRQILDAARRRLPDNLTAAPRRPPPDKRR